MGKAKKTGSKAPARRHRNDDTESEVSVAALDLGDLSLEPEGPATLDSEAAARKRRLDG
eukprot:CAMPEP_0119266270 /NCGR_PEP_ID=MMETSP1329-20130426/4815_1 /TAXON_ID=114041 /ORGANISM="Genus nov. species nov., Strain RCC1024" /LENGTH=58 /DNA_ID=CAMNT_0007266139 /DNA_START=310 /DNA_END=483 /DNA_ORIENTATION=-